ncbi:MAG TPA: low temperature requirement protein A [Candidatus Binatia bacterium]|nr:low temperature requirement protein A [Candidatus Binatia bacterium]
MVATAVEHEHSVTPRELFFDLVFVFAFTQVATLLSDDPTFAGIGRGVLVVAALWWPWTAYAWLTNTVDPEEGFVGAALLVALIAMFLAALAVPGVFGDDGVLFGAAFLVVVAMHLALYALAGRGHRDLFVAVLRLAPWTLLGAVLILVAGFGFADGARIWLWVAALACTYVGAGLSGSTGWRVYPSHLAERYGLVLIIALGEAFVAIGIGATGVGIGLGEVVAAILGLLIATSFWLAYFDFFSIRGERMLAELRGPDRIALARDVYAYAHLPMIVGIVLFAFAMKTIVAHVGEELDFAVAFALCGGSALYLLTYSGIRIRIERRVRLSSGRFVAALALLLALPLATVIPALAALAVVTAVWLALHAYELVLWREARQESRSLLASP